MALLFLSTAERAAVWRSVFADAGEEMLVGEEAVSDPSRITHVACWQPPGDLARYRNLKVVLSIGAGVDQIPRLPDGVALARTIAPGIEDMVRAWVVMATLMLHRDMPRYLEQSRHGLWQAHPARPAGMRRVGIMGMGRIGRLAAQSLAQLGFPVAGWSRSGTPVDSVDVYDEAGLGDFLARSDILVCLLPLTDETRGLLDAKLFAQLPKGACLVHAGRAAHLDMAALRMGLTSGRLCTAMLDVADPEPLPADHWAWRKPNLIVTPHVASHTDPHEGARHALEVVRASRAGDPIPGLVDQSRGY
ncbi:glyoxylate/hydroxypyruvate reductase A [Breoghania corrubedonensis]|uniref:Glyoxylate/hydroxypyruvate reductase A n=1 Tax=Breoghania corrubedonensis TaxID=665038 RepID=A0A2T5VGL4_9HYPH|nr:glyoxylate/hydroxypyruvate reductase A [Breoghania corrubedonensis]PTW62901.1 glyoxylate/hydroxypyruvate reductase A [Breoghania corrubedonensis]